MPKVKHRHRPLESLYGPAIDWCRSKQVRTGPDRSGPLGADAAERSQETLYNIKNIETKRMLNYLGRSNMKPPRQWQLDEMTQSFQMKKALEIFF